MKIAMFTNTYLPHVGGVARSVSNFAESYRKLGHECIVIAPEFEEKIPDEKDVYRVPAITNFNDSGFSFKLPFASDLSDVLDEFEPDIIHSHHPFLLGDTALKAAYTRELPIVFTHHTLYEQYTNYLPFDGDFTKKAAIELATSFANTCSLVFAPSKSIADLIQSRGVEVPIVVQPTGIDIESAKSGNGDRFRKKYGIESGTLLIGHVGRIAAEKNLEYLTNAVCEALTQCKQARFVLVGSGDLEKRIKEIVEERGLTDQFVPTGSLQGQELSDAYAAFHVFAFASQSETQGLVLAEAMAGGSPVVALEGPGVGDILEQGKNGLLLPANSDEGAFAKELLSVLNTSSENRAAFQKHALVTAESLSLQNTAQSALRHYKNAIGNHMPRVDSTGIEEFDKLIAGFEGELELLKVRASTVAAAITS